MPFYCRTATLYVVSTPIGNLEDITSRALRILKEVDLIAAEDTRKTKKLLTHYGIKAKVLSYREQNKEKQGKSLIALLKEGKHIAIVSNAGTPCISDPGVHLVDLAIKAGIKVVPVPGPSALIAALSVCGLPSHPFVFLGFLPRREGRRKKMLLSFKNTPYTIVFYESPHRFKRTLEIVTEIFPKSEVAVARELTKLHEEIIRAKAAEIPKKLTEGEIKGEITIIIAGESKHPST
jgi:16S rRNA (cytidine1402-2'-O)-methyltransferase